MNTLLTIIHSDASLILDVLLRATALLALSFVAEALLRRRSATTRHALWLATSAALLVLPIIALFLPAWRLPVLAAPSQSVDVAPSAPNESVAIEPMTRQINQSAVNTPLRETASIPAARPVRAVEQLASVREFSPPLSNWLLLIWLSGVAIVLGLITLSGFLVQRFLQQTVVADEATQTQFDALCRELKVAARIRLRMSRACGLPLSCGLIHRTIVLPESARRWSELDRRHALLHEMGHACRFDCLSQLLGQVAAAVYWFHPLVWLANRRLRIERELACDEWALQRGAQPSIYAQHLLAIARDFRGRWLIHLAAAPMARPSRLKWRVSRILDESRRGNPRLAQSVFVAFTVVALLTIPLACVHLTPRNPSMKTAATTQPSRTLDLQVVDDKTGAPVANAKVVSDGWEPHEKLLTDQAGHVLITIPDHPIPMVQLQVSPKDHIDMLLEWFPKNGKLDLPASFALPLEKGIVVGGKVVDEAAKPIAGAHVILGVYTDPYTPPQRYFLLTNSLLTDSQGIWSQRIPSDANIGGTTVWDLRYASPIDSKFMRVIPQRDLGIERLKKRTAVTVLHTGAPLKGTVADGQQQPVAGATVELDTQYNGNDSQPHSITGDNGAFSFTFNPSQKVSLLITAPGFAAAHAAVDMKATTQPIKVVLGEAHHLGGQLLDANDHPVRQLYFWFNYPAENQKIIRKHFRTDDDGQFSWDQAPAGSLTGTVIGETGNYGETKKIELSESRRATIKLLPSTRPSRDDAILITGTVVDAVTHKPIENFNLQSGWSYDPRMTADYSNSHWKSLGGGTFAIRNARPYNATQLRIEADGHYAKESPVIPTTQKSATWDVQLQPGDDLDTTVLTTDDRPAAGATAILLSGRQEGFTFDGRTDRDSYPSNRHYKVAADGSLKLPPQREAATLFVFAPQGYAIANDAALKSKAPIRLQPYAVIHGKLLMGKRPIFGQRVAISAAGVDDLPDDQRVFNNITATADEKGEFTFDHVLAVKSSISRQILVQFSNYSIENAGPRTVVDPQPGQMLETTVNGLCRTVEGDLEIDPQLLQLPDSRWSDQCQLSSRTRHYVVSIDPNGHFQVDDVAPDQYQLFVYREVGSAENPIQISIGPAKVDVSEATAADADKPVKVGPIKLALPNHPTTATTQP